MMQRYTSTNFIVPHLCQNVNIRQNRAADTVELLRKKPIVARVRYGAACYICPKSAVNVFFALLISLPPIT